MIDLSSFYGRSNYSCRSKNTNCSIGNLVKPRCKTCPYQGAKDKAVSSANTVMNYALSLGLWKYTNTFNDSDLRPIKRRLLIADEAHTLEDHLVNFDAVKVASWRCDKYKVKFKTHDNMRSALKWMEDLYLPAMRAVLENLATENEYLMEKSSADLTKPELKALQEMKDLDDHVFGHCAVFTTDRYAEINDSYVLVNDPTTFEFKRITGAYSFQTTVEPMAEQFLFMSSTILDYKGFCEDLGIDPNEAAFLSLPSEFDVDRRPVYYMPQTKMNYKWNQPENAKGRDAVLRTIEELCNEIHEGESGIIHTANFKIAEYIVANANIDQQIFHHNPESGDDRNSIIKAFMGSPKPGVLISPSCTEGLDLKDDLGRFAIFAKVPYGFLGDQWIKKRMEMSGRWYQRRAIIDMIQGAGRVVRGMEDEGNVYILDETFGYLYQQTYSMIPQWWKDGFHEV
jgi:Rad3-related DNA helicase